MKILDDLCDDIPGTPVTRRSSIQRNRISEGRAFDAGERQWPALSAPARPDVATLEHMIAKQAAELTLRCTQVADLYNIRQQQANELQIACDEIDGLSNTISTLLETTARHEAESAAAKEKLIILENEKAALRTQLEKAYEGSAELSRRLLVIETAFNDRETAIASASDNVKSLTAELTAASAEKFKLVAAMEGGKLRHRSELSQQKSSFESKIKKIESANEDQDAQIKQLEAARDKLAKRVDFLDAFLRSEREAAKLKTKELAEELQRERLRHSAEDRASAAMREEMVFLLPKLVAQRNQTSAPEHEAPALHNNAA